MLLDGIKRDPFKSAKSIQSYFKISFSAQLRGKWVLNAKLQLQPQTPPSSPDGVASDYEDDTVDGSSTRASDYFSEEETEDDEVAVVCGTGEFEPSSCTPVCVGGKGYGNDYELEGRRPGVIDRKSVARAISR